MKKNALDRLCQLLSRTSKNSRVLRDLLTDLLSKAEIEDIGLRCKILDGLMENKSQRDIAKELGVSISKVTRGSHVLQQGSGAYAKIAKK